MGKFDKVLRIRVVLPPFDMYRLFHIANLLRNRSSTPSHTVTDLNKTPKGRPK